MIANLISVILYICHHSINKKPINVDYSALNETNSEVNDWKLILGLIKLQI